MSAPDTGRTAGPGRLRAAGVAVALTVAAVLASLVGGVAFLLPLFVLAVDVQSPAAFLALTVVGQLAFLAVGVGYARYRGVVVPIERPTPREVGLAVGGTVTALVIVVALSSLIDLLGLTPGSVIGDVAAVEPNLLLSIGVLSIVLVAPIEEFLFRGVVQGTLVEAYGPVGGVVGSSLLFGSVHLANYTGDPGAVVAGALLIAGTGAVLGTLYEATGNLTVSILTHGLYNLTLSLIAYATM
ncbi:MAG: lysostaphin resistance A-like protein [Haloarculaceae archaeon]